MYIDFDKECGLIKAAPPPAFPRATRCTIPHIAVDLRNCAAFEMPYRVLGTPYKTRGPIVDQQYFTQLA